MGTTATSGPESRGESLALNLFTQSVRYVVFAEPSPLLIRMLCAECNPAFFTHDFTRLLQDCTLVTLS